MSDFRVQKLLLFFIKKNAFLCSEPYSSAKMDFLPFMK